MRIKMLLTNGFDPDIRVYKEAKTLVENGHDVEILCWDREQKNIGKQKEILNGMKINRFFIKGKYGSGYHQLLGYVRFIKSVLKYLKENDCDAVHCHDFDTLYIGYRAKKKNKKIRLIFDEHDLFYLYFKNRSGIINNIMSSLIRRVQTKLLKYVDKHIVVTPNMSKLYGEANVIIINNAPYSDAFKDIKKTERNDLVIGYIGSVRYLKELKALSDIANKFDNVSVFIAGRGTVLNELIEYCSSKCYTNVTFKGQFHFEQLEELYKQVDYIYSVYPMTDGVISLPNKFFECILTETPIIAERSSEFGKIIEDKNIGYAVDSNDLDKELDRVITSIIDGNVASTIKRNMHKCKHEYSWESNINKLLDIYK